LGARQLQLTVILSPPRRCFPSRSNYRECVR
jgi:hypothetical protein